MIMARRAVSIGEMVVGDGEQNDLQLRQYWEGMFGFVDGFMWLVVVVLAVAFCHKFSFCAPAVLWL